MGERGYPKYISGKMKKALLIKLESPAYSSIGIERAFKEHFEVQSINWQAIRFSNGTNGLQVIWDTILNECDTFNPDLIFIQLQVEYILTTDQFKELGKRSFVINYTEDVREDIQWMEDAAPHIGLTIFTNQDDVDKLKSKGILNAAYMPVSYNDVWYRPVPKTDKYYGDIVFIGHNNVNSNLNFPYAQERQDMIKFMKVRFGDKFRSSGMGQEFQMLPPAEVIQAYSNCKIVITQNNFKRKGYCSDRGLNAMGCGAIVIHQYFEGCTDIFNEAPHLHTWDTFDKLQNMCKAFLGGAEKKYRHEETAKYTKENHSWHKRIKDLMKLVYQNYSKFSGVSISDGTSRQVTKVVNGMTVFYNERIKKTDNHN